MKQLVKEVENEGLDGLLGKRVLLMSAGYFYEGELVGANSKFVKLSDPHVVYETGKWTDVKYLDIQKMHKDTWYVQTGLIESYGESKSD